jgi:opacity protein-like surface antigen
MDPQDFHSVSLPGAARGASFDFAWDVTAGFSYQVSRQFLIDTSYRYLHIGTPQVDLGGFGNLSFGSMDAHELKTGFRYMID